jgi:hypothetical protein
MAQHRAFLPREDHRSAIDSHNSLCGSSISGVVNMRQHLAEIAHVDQRAADQTITEMIGLGLGNAVCIDAGFDHRICALAQRHNLRIRLS